MVFHNELHNIKMYYDSRAKLLLFHLAKNIQATNYNVCTYSPRIVCERLVKV